MTTTKSKIFIILILALVLGAAGGYAGVRLAVSQTEIAATAAVQDANTSSTETSISDLSKEEQQQLIESIEGGKEMMKVLQAYELIQDNYVEEVEGNALIEGAIEGMLGTLEDPYSAYMDVEEMKSFSSSIESSFEGIGAEVSMVDETVTIVAPIKDSPAEAAGLKPKDQILKVDSESIEGLDLNEAVAKIRGEKGTTVELEVKRPGVDHLLTIEVTRDNIPLETVYAETTTVEGKKVGVIEITTFAEKTADRFEEELARLEEEGIEGLVIDVRGNPGGLFTAVEQILGNFITNEKPLAKMEDRNGEIIDYYSDLTEPKDYPINVLINEGSASASEILAAALKEAAGAEVIGTTSFGKGTVQQTAPMGDGSTIKLTMFKWLTPDGNWIHEKGVEPTVEVKQPDYFYTSPLEVEEPIQQGQSNDKIKAAQIMLAGLGYDPGNKEGDFTEATEEAVAEFQTDNELEITGEINKETAGLLEAAIVEKIMNKENDEQKQAALEELF